MRTPYPNELMHYGIPGMRKGVRRWQNEDGSLTAAGRQRYLDGSQTRLSRPSGRTTSVTGSASAPSVRKNAQGFKKGPTTGGPVGKSSDLFSLHDYDSGSTEYWSPALNRYVRSAANAEATSKGRQAALERARGAQLAMPYSMRQLQTSSARDQAGRAAELSAQQKWNNANTAARKNITTSLKNASTIASLKTSSAFKKASSAVKSTASSAVKSLTSWASGLFGKKKKG